MHARNVINTVEVMKGENRAPEQHAEILQNDCIGCPLFHRDSRHAFDGARPVGLA